MDDSGQIRDISCGMQRPYLCKRKGRRVPIEVEVESREEETFPSTEIETKTEATTTPLPASKQCLSLQKITPVRQTGRARQISVGADGSIYIIGTNAMYGGYGIWRRQGGKWKAVNSNSGRR